MSDSEHEHEQFVILNVIDDSVVADANTELTASAL